MAQGDIRSFSSPLGGTTRTVHVQMGGATTTGTASTSWRAGEVLVIDAAAGDVNAIADGGSNADTTLHVIPATSSAAEIQLGNLTSGAAAQDRSVPVIPLLADQEFVTQYVFNNSDTQLALTLAAGVIVGATAGFWRDDSAVTGLPGGSANGVNGRFGIDLNGSGLVITRILDSDGNDARTTGSAYTGNWVVFRADT